MTSRPQASLTALPHVGKDELDLVPRAEGSAL